MSTTLLVEDHPCRGGGHCWKEISKIKKTLTEMIHTLSRPPSMNEDLSRALDISTG
jgi:hypothetical protein